MKQFLMFLLVISVGINVFFLQRKIKLSNRSNEEKKLIFYKKISYEQGYDYFVKQFKKSYPETVLNNKDVIVYRWDSTHYDSMYKEQMKALDSMATSFGKYKLEYIFVTEMEEAASKSFLRRNQDEYKNVKMLFGMDDFISGLHNIKGLKHTKVIVNNVSHITTEIDSSIYCVKEFSFYSIIDSDGKVLFTNKIGSVIKDTAFLNKLKGLLPDKNVKILN